MTTAALAGLAMTLLSLVGCGGPKEATSTTTTTETGAKLTTSDHLDVMVFAGGFGSDFYEAAAKEYEKANPGVTVTVTGDAHIDEQLKPLFMEGEPPSLAFPGWRFDHWAAVEDGQVMDLDTVLKGKPFSGDGTWGDTFEPSLLKLGKSKGKQWVMPYFFSVLGWWYDPDLFKANGWEPPKTYADLLGLCQKIQAKGIAPITYQGQYPDYMIAGMLEPWVISAGGIDAFNKMQNLEPGAWDSEPVIKAAKMIYDLHAQDYFERGATAMSHTDAQSEFINDKAAMIPCGTWLHSEMQSSLPKGRKMAFFLPPVIGDGKGDPSAVMIKIEPWLIAQKGPNQEHAVGFFKYLTSLDKAKQFVKEKGTFMAVKGANDQELPDYLAGAGDAFKNSKTVWAAQWKDWYPGFYKEVEGNITKMLNGELTPEQFGKECEAAAERARNNPDLVKHTVE